MLLGLYAPPRFGGTTRAFGVFEVLFANVRVEVTVIGKGARSKGASKNTGETQEASCQFFHGAWVNISLAKPPPIWAARQAGLPRSLSALRLGASRSRKSHLDAIRFNDLTKKNWPKSSFSLRPIKDFASRLN